MPLESLLSLADKLRKRIDDYGPKLRKNEALTRAALIDPLLRELGWDTEDPALVIPEYNVGTGHEADYALLRDRNDRNPIMLVEAKSLGTALRGEPLEQGLRYCGIKRTPYLSITDGEHWEIYRDTNTYGDPDKKRLVQFDLKDSSATETCLKALALWELRMSGRIDRGQTPVVAPTPPQPDQPESPNEWQPISELNPQLGSIPVKVQFPDDSDIQVTTWRALLEQVVRWLIKNNHLQTSHCPLPGKPNGKSRYAVSTEPVHLGGRRFVSPVQVGSFYVETHGGRRWSVRAARTVIKRVEQDPSQFKVRFSRQK